MHLFKLQAFKLFDNPLFKMRPTGDWSVKFQLLQELEYFRGQHRAAMNQLEVSAQEASSLRGKYGDLLNDNQRCVKHFIIII